MKQIEHSLSDKVCIEILEGNSFHMIQKFNEAQFCASAFTRENYYLCLFL
jgi:hypothetical protein